MPLDSAGEIGQLTGSTFYGLPAVVGGVYYGSGSAGSLPAYVTALQTDVSGAVYITVTGTLPVTFSGTQLVDIGNWPATIGISGSTALRTWDGGTQGVSGTISIGSQVSVNNFPATQAVSGTVTANVVFPTQQQVFISGTVGVSGSATQPIWVTTTGSLPVAPGDGAVFPISIAAIVSVAQQGQLQISNFPATQNVSGTVIVQGGTAGAVAPVQIWSEGTIGVSGTFSSTPVFSNTPQGVTGSQLTGSTFTGYPVTIGGVYYGSGNVGSLPAYVKAIQTDISGAQYITTSGSIAVAPGDGVVFPVSIAATVNTSQQGQLQISNFPATQAVSGTLAAFIQNWPAVLGVSGTVSVANTTIAGTGSIAPMTGALVGAVDESGNFQSLYLKKTRLFTSSDEQVLLTETWDSSTIDSNKWTTSAIFGAAASASTGSLTLGSGGSISSAASCISIASFAPVGAGSISFYTRAATPITSSVFGFLGLGSTSTVSTPPTECVGFEFTTGGVINCVVGSAGFFTRTAITSSYTDGNYHNYAITCYTNTFVFNVDGVTVATVTPLKSSIDLLPRIVAMKVIGQINPTGTVVPQAWRISDIHVTESTRTSAFIADATYPTQRARVSQYGALAHANLDDLVAMSQVLSLVGSTTPSASVTKCRRIGMVSATQQLLNDAPSTTYAILTAGSSTGNIVSTSVNDASAGTGAQTISYVWIDALNGQRHTSTATLNGTTNVPQTWTNGLLAVESMTVATAGSSGAPAGTISIKSAGAATISQLASGSAYLSAWTGTKFSTSGKTTLIRNWRGSMSGTGGTFTLLRANWLGTVDTGILGMPLDTVFCPASGSFSIRYNPPLVVPTTVANFAVSCTNVTVSVTPVAATACNAWSSFDTIEL